MTSVKAGASPACPAVRTNVRGRAPAVGREVDLRGQSAAGAADGVVVRLTDLGPFCALRPRAGARMIVESTETAQAT